MAQNDKNSQTDLDGLEKMGMPDGQPRPIACLPIIGQIEGHMALSDSSKTTKYEHILPMLVDIEQNDKVQGLLLLLNTVGGDVEAGLAIAEMVAGMRKPSVSLVIGGGHSIGVPLAVSTRKSFIVPSATMTRCASPAWSSTRRSRWIISRRCRRGWCGLSAIIPA